MLDNTSLLQLDHAEAEVLICPEGSVSIVPLPSGRLKVTLTPNNLELYVPRLECETTLPRDLIEFYLRSSFAWLCECLARHDDPANVRGTLQRQLFAYIAHEDFRGKRLLDFGCGSGASTFCIGTMLPETEVIGIDLLTNNIDIAEQILALRKLPNVRFALSPDPMSLPAVGKFDFVMLSAVYEHLLPAERGQLLALIWESMNPDGVLFINQTPHRYFPYEHHSTGLWFINYLPDSLSFLLARKFSRLNQRINKSRDWTVHLRGGIRGGSEREIIRHLRRIPGGQPKILQPIGSDRARYWLSCTDRKKYRLLKMSIAALFRLTDRLLDTVPSINLDVVIRKEIV